MDEQAFTALELAQWDLAKARAQVSLLQAELAASTRLSDAKLAHQYRTIESMCATATEALEREAAAHAALQELSSSSYKPLGYLALGAAIGAVLALLVPYTML